MESSARETAINTAFKAWIDRVQASRQEDDKRLFETYDDRFASFRSHLGELYERKLVVENDLRQLCVNIESYEVAQEKTTAEYQAQRCRLEEQRKQEEETQLQWIARCYDKEERKSREASDSSLSVCSSSSAAIDQQTNDDAGDRGTRGWTSINGAARSRGSSSRRDDDDDDDDEEPPADPGNLIGNGYHAVVDDEVTENDWGFAAGKSKNGDRPLKLKARQSLPATTASVKNGSPVSGEAKKGKGRKSLPAARNQMHSPEPVDPSELTEINKEALLLRHDGEVFTEPPLMAGVPVERIHPQHPYWDPEWQPLEDLIKPQLDKWASKLDFLRRTPGSVRHTVFLANRQVNRGNTILQFLDHGEVHPYQYVGKNVINQYFKAFTNYDTIFRLINIYEELKKFDLDVTPIEWLRHRACELAAREGVDFNFAKFTHNLYHDRKIQALREKHGFGNIGRPSGFRVGDKPEKKPRKKAEPRKKGARTISQTDFDEPSAMNQQEFLEPVTPRSKRQTLETARAPAMPPSTEPRPDDTQYDGYTSTDSFSNGRIAHVDFRVHQIKTKKRTTSPDVTQYWTFQLEKGKFEHQVLRDVFPKVTWGYYQKKRANFDLHLKDVVEIQYSAEADKVQVVVSDQEHGNVLAYFKRPRTKKRFLALAKKQNLKLVRTNPGDIEAVWDGMNSKIMENEDSDDV